MRSSVSQSAGVIPRGTTSAEYNRTSCKEVLQVRVEGACGGGLRMPDRGLRGLT